MSTKDDDKPPRDPSEVAKEVLGQWKESLKQNFDKLLVDAKVDAGKLKADGGDLGRRLIEKFLPLAQAATGSPRMRRLVSELMLIAGSFRLFDARGALTTKVAQAEREAAHRAAAERLVKLCLEMRGGVLRVGQVIASRPDVLPPVYAEVFAQLATGPSKLSLETLGPLLEAELGASITDRFADFEARPMSSNAISQVHGAELLDGRRVVVKVQIPGVGEVVDGDLAMLKVGVSLVHRFVRPFDADALYAELARTVKQELDFAAEAVTARRVGEVLAGDADLVVPRVVDEVSTPHVLTLDRIDGEPLGSFLDRARGAGDSAGRDRVLGALVRSYAVQVLALGRFQSDPEPTNFMVTSDGRLALLDFGAFIELTPELQAGYAALARALLERDPDGAAAALGVLGFSGDGGEAGRAALAKSLVDAIDGEAERPAGGDRRRAGGQLLAVARREKMAVPYHFIQLGRAVDAVAALLAKYDAKVDVSALLEPLLRRS